MSEKKEVIRIIEALPDNVSLEEILREIYIHTRFQRGVQEEMNGRRGKKKVNSDIDSFLH